MCVCVCVCVFFAGTLLKLTVAATFVIELPATPLILAPWRPLRVIGAVLQAFLQVAGTTACSAAPPPAHAPAQACSPAATDGYGKRAARQREGLKSRDTRVAPNRAAIVRYETVGALSGQGVCSLMRKASRRLRRMMNITRPRQIASVCGDQRFFW